MELAELYLQAASTMPEVRMHNAYYNKQMAYWQIIQSMQELEKSINGQMLMQHCM
uniref:Uncharacterized protein n=1 Tax=Moniliophthora roreri TaxID=221103 RepID=A0A0W0G2X4_MONRR